MDKAQVKQNMIQFGHWIALSASIVILAFVFLFSGNKKAEKEIKRCAKVYKKFRKKLKLAQVPKKEVFPYYEQLKNNWTSSAKAIPGPGQDNIYEGAVLITKEGAAPEQQFMNVPRSFNLNKGDNSINLRWRAPSPYNNKNLPTIDGYILHKSWKNDKGKKQVKIFNLTKMRFFDKKLKPRVRYYYKVCAYTTNLKAKKWLAL